MWITNLKKKKNFWKIIRYLTCAAMTLCRSAMRLHLQHVQSLNWQCLLWPLSQEISPWFRHLAHLGLRPVGSFSSKSNSEVGLEPAGLEPATIAVLATVELLFILAQFATKCNYRPIFSVKPSSMSNIASFPSCPPFDGKNHGVFTRTTGDKPAKADS